MPFLLKLFCFVKVGRKQFYFLFNSPNQEEQSAMKELFSSFSIFKHIC